MWKKKRFIGNEEVGWRTFEKELREILKYPKDPTPSDQLKFKCLKAVLADAPKKKLGKEKEVVNLVKFGNILDWFGPFEKDDSGLDFLDRLEDMLKKKWFHGDISTPKATDRLNGQEAGTFLVRFSTSTPGCYTISSVDASQRVLHQRVVYHPRRGYEFWNKTYESMKELIKKEKKHHNLLKACPGSPYKHLFVEEDGNDSQQGCYVAAPTPASAPASSSSEKKREKKSSSKKKKE